ncbi:MerR family transcriptional regulator [Pseudooceanicola spongiae]|uniref:MerR family transcriptional regulator n=1 Tax=Pseudooceanicola spongiae TaxID=2613965 RepID=UPI001D015724|nr:MerR family transcriptional regulator [Pseudooceanicola spongiae]
MVKSADAFRTISEVAEWLETPAHVLRFWESKFTQVKPVKRAGGRRYYRPADMELLGGIKRLLHDEGMTIKGVQKMLRDHGIPHVAAMSPALEDMAAPLQAEIVPLRRPSSIPHPQMSPNPVTETTGPHGAPAPDHAQASDETAHSAYEEPAVAAEEVQLSAEDPTEESIEMSAYQPGDLAFELPQDPDDDAYDVAPGVLGLLAMRRSAMPTDVAMEAWMLARKLTRTLS